MLYTRGTKYKLFTLPWADADSVHHISAGLLRVSCVLHGVRFSNPNVNKAFVLLLLWRRASGFSLACWFEFNAYITSYVLFVMMFQITFQLVAHWLLFFTGNLLNNFSPEGKTTKFEFKQTYTTLATETSLKNLCSSNSKNRNRRNRREIGVFSVGAV